MTISDIIVVTAIFLLILSFCMPAKVEIVEGKIHFSVWPFFNRAPKRIEELKNYRIKMGMFPIRLEFKDGTVYKWTSFPLGRHNSLRNEIEKHIKGD